MVPPAGWGFVGKGRGERTLPADVVKREHDRAHDDRVSRQQLRGGNRYQVEMRMGSPTMAARQLETDATGDVVMDLGVGRAVVLGFMVVRNAVAYLGKEESQAQKRGKQEARDARATRVPHGTKITRARRKTGPALYQTFLTTCRCNHTRPTGISSGAAFPGPRR